MSCKFAICCNGSWETHENVFNLNRDRNIHSKSVQLRPCPTDRKTQSTSQIPSRTSCLYFNRSSTRRKDHRLVDWHLISRRGASKKRRKEKENTRQEERAKWENKNSLEGTHVIPGDYAEELSPLPLAWFDWINNRAVSRGKNDSSAPSDELHVCV